MKMKNEKMKNEKKFKNHEKLKNQNHNQTTEDFDVFNEKEIEEEEEIEEAAHCKYGAQFRFSESSSEFGPICKLNHYRPEFFTKCDKKINKNEIITRKKKMKMGEKNTVKETTEKEKPCNVYKGQRSVYLFQKEIKSNLNETIPSYLNNQRNLYHNRYKRRTNG